MRPMSTPDGLLKMSELAEQSGVSAGTIKHYLREGLLPEPVRTSRNMAYYPPEFVERIRLIKRLQEDRFMPLRLIKGVMDEDPERAHALIELEDRIIERAAAAQEQGRVSRAEGPPPLRGARQRARTPGGPPDPLPELPRLRRRRGSRSSRRSRASAPAATTSASASPSTTPSATARRSSRW